MAVRLKTNKEIQILQEGGAILGSILGRLEKLVAPGASSKMLEERAEKWIAEAGGTPSFKGHVVGGEAFPSALCVSVNSELVHGPALPERFFKEGDIVSLDIGMRYQGLYTDTALTVAVGSIDAHVRKLLEVTQQCLELGIRQAKPGNTLGDIARAVQINAEANNFSVIRELVGHGVGHEVHEEPQVPNFVTDEKKVMDYVLKPGLVIAIEPMLAVGDWHTTVLDDTFTFAMQDGGLSAHFEHTVAITEDGNRILTDRGTGH